MRTYHITCVIGDYKTVIVISNQLYNYLIYNNLTIEVLSTTNVSNFREAFMKIIPPVVNVIFISVTKV